MRAACVMIGMFWVASFELNVLTWCCYECYLLTAVFWHVIRGILLPVNRLCQNTNAHTNTHMNTNILRTYTHVHASWPLTLTWAVFRSTNESKYTSSTTGHTSPRHTFPHFLPGPCLILPSSFRSISPQHPHTILCYNIAGQIVFSLKGAALPWNVLNLLERCLIEGDAWAWLRRKTH